MKIEVPKAPSKFDVIPIHASDRGSFKMCRRRWNWTSPMRNNLTPKAEYHGIYMPLWFGSGIHWAMKLYYDPMLKRDPVETFTTWWDIQWNGGVVTEDWLETTYDRLPQVYYNGSLNGEQDTYKVKGLQGILPMAEIEREEFEAHRDLGIGMMTFYRDYAAKNDRFDVIASEHTFSVPIYDPNTDSEMRRIDPRDGVEKEVHLRGTQDGIIQDWDTEFYGILEHKSAISVDDEYFVKLDKDEQCTTYMFSAEVEARMHDLPYKEIRFVLYNALRKAYPKLPTITKRGDISINRAVESTTYEMLMQTIEDMGMSDYWMHDERLANYVHYVQERGDEQFVVRNTVFRNRAELISCGERVYMEAHDMLNSPFIYPNPTGSWSCLRCTFRAPCIAMDDGSDWEYMIEDQFEKNWTR